MAAVRRQQDLDLALEFGVGVVVDLDVLGLKRGQVAHALLSLDGRLTGLLQLGALGLELRGRGDAHDVALDDHAQILLQEHEVKGLIPGDVHELQGDVPGDVVVEDEVVAADLGDETQDLFDGSVLQVDGNLFARVVFLHAREERVQFLNLALLVHRFIGGGLVGGGHGGGLRGLARLDQNMRLVALAQDGKGRTLRTGEDEVGVAVLVVVGGYGLDLGAELAHVVFLEQ
ncbi:hypothetical protein DSECCO2_535870 [anaerobic digester metagenome]